MGAQVEAHSEARVEAPADAVRRALADYATVRPRILPEQYRDYRVLEGGVGQGTVAAWTLQATSKRSRDVVADVDITTQGNVVERDRNSTLVTTWSVEALGDRASRVRVDTTWQGAGGVKGFFERTFAPKGLARIHGEVLARLGREVAGR
ncbi:SRPBCC family protein [Patulibacter sp. SYSU D01012]|uniref:SRPBCC family protein n=1 Tax=Patulibacter sp. SYSU D01012 TaxID=2817381 RepID=UPI001B310136|nr:SRPBCC family protein [Patulibacter sp. SYSU D01012]